MLVTLDALPSLSSAAAAIRAKEQAHRTAVVKPLRQFYSLQKVRPIIAKPQEKLIEERSHHRRDLVFFLLLLRHHSTVHFFAVNESQAPPSTSLASPPHVLAHACLVILERPSLCLCQRNMCHSTAFTFVVVAVVAARGNHLCHHLRRSPFSPSAPPLAPSNLTIADDLWSKSTAIIAIVSPSSLATLAPCQLRRLHVAPSSSHGSPHGRTEP